MSRSDTYRPVQSPARQAGIALELRHSRLCQLPMLLGADLAGVLRAFERAADLGDVMGAMDTLPEGNPISAVELLAAESRAMDMQAQSAGIDRQVVTPLSRQIDDLRAAAAQVPAEELGRMTEETFALAEQVETALVDAVIRARTLQLTAEAVAATLERMDLDVTVGIVGDEVAITGISASGEHAAVHVDGDPAAIEASFVDPADAVHPLHPAAGEPCHGAATRAQEFHTLLPEEMAARGLRVGRVKAMTPPTRGAPASRSRRRQAGGATRRSAAG